MKDLRSQKTKIQMHCHLGPSSHRAPPPAAALFWSGGVTAHLPQHGSSSDGHLTTWLSTGRKDSEPPKDKAPRTGAGHRFGVEHSHGLTQYWVFIKGQEESARCLVTRLTGFLPLCWETDSPEFEFPGAHARKGDCCVMGTWTGTQWDDTW